MQGETVGGIEEFMTVSHIIIERIMEGKDAGHYRATVYGSADHHLTVDVYQYMTLTSLLAALENAGL